MAEQNLGTDLFGDPVLPRREGPGRPEAVWNRETSSRVLLAFALGWTVKRTAGLVGLSTPTLRKVFFSECAKRTIARDKHELRQLELLANQAEGGNVTASKELDKRLERIRQRETAQAMAGKAPKPVKLGKKEAAEKAAIEQRGLYEPPAPPQLN